MLETGKLVVVSDLHLAPGLSGSPAFAAFLDHLLGAPPCHLVVAGDLFDLLAAGDPAKPAAFDPDNAPRLLRETVATHVALFSRLTRLAERPGARVTVMGGNHDVEICLPAARLELLQLLGPHVQWLVHGEALAFTVGGARVVIEHGDLYDDWNRVDYGPLIVAGRLHSRGEPAGPGDPPPGSLVVTRFLNGLRKDYRWLEWIKPETALVPLLHAILSPRERLRLMALIGPYLSQARRSTERRLLRAVGSGRLIRGRADGDVRQPATAGTSARRSLSEWYRETQNGTTRSTGAKADAALAAKLGRRAAGDGFFDPSVADPFAAELARLPRFHSSQLVVLGHSHAAKALSLDNGLLYMNAGAWCPLVPLPAADAPTAEWTEFLAALRANSLRPNWRNTYVEVEAVEPGCQARLIEWTDGASKPLAAGSWDPQTSWRLGK